MTRKQWKKQAKAYSDAAQTLLRDGQHTVAYHLAGLAVECALKAKIAAAFKASTWPTKAFVDSIHTHDLAKLVKQADLESTRQAEEASSATFRAHWNTVKEWTVESRYKEWSPAEARDMVEAVTRRSTGVLAWKRRRW